MSRITPSNPANILTPAYSTVSSPAGFQSGDLVYYKDSSFGPIPGNAVANANFPITNTLGLNRTPDNATMYQANIVPDNYNGSNSRRVPNVALLSNGNLVVVYGEHYTSGDSLPFFKILDQNGNIVVNRTNISGEGVDSQGKIGVCALVGGGFAVSFRSSGANSMFIAVYSNTGTVVLAPTLDPNFLSYTSFDIKPLSGGGFVVGTNNNDQGTSTFRFSTFSSVGTLLTTNLATGLTANGSQPPVIATFNDNSFAAAIPSVTASQLLISRFNSAGAFVANTIVDSSFISTPTAQYDFITLTNNTGVVLYTVPTTFFTVGRTYTQSTGIVSASTTINTTISQTVNAAPLSSGGFVVTSAVSASGMTRLLSRNSSLGAVASVDLPGLSAYTYQAWCQKNTIIEGSTFISVFDNSFASTGFVYHTVPYYQIDKNNFSTAGIRRQFPASVTTGSINAPVSGYARSNSTPNSAAFLATTTGTLTQTMPASQDSTFVLTPYTAVGNTDVVCQALTEMNNGQFVIAFQLASGPVRFSVFNNDGSLVSTTTVSSTSTGSLVRCACLTNGKLLISWCPTSTSIQFAVYSTSYTLLATGTTSGATGAGITVEQCNNQASAAGHDIAAFGSNGFVVVFYNTGQNFFVATFNDSVVYQNVATATNNGTMQGLRIASDNSGDVAVKGFNATTNQGFVEWFLRNGSEYSIATYVLNTSSTFNGQNFGEGIALSPYGSVFSFERNTSNRRIARSMPGNSPFLQTIGAWDWNAAGVTVGQFGEFITIQMDNTAVRYSRYSPNSAAPGSYSGQSANAIVTNNLTITDYSVASSPGSQAQIASLYDNVCAISYITNAGTIKVGLINTVAATYTTTTTAGVTPSGSALVPSPANGYYLAGISASECAAGGTGVVQINGAATLNSQYPAGTTSQAFDFNTPALDVGVRGTIAGRNVIISGGR